MTDSKSQLNPDQWQSLLDDAFGSPEPPAVPVSTLEPDPLPTLGPEPAPKTEVSSLKEPRHKTFFTYKKPQFWILCAAAVAFLAAMLYISPTILSLNLHPELKSCKNALDEWQSRQTYGLRTHAQVYDDNGIRYEFTENLQKSEKDWLQYTSVLYRNNLTDTMLLRKDGKFFRKTDSTIYKESYLSFPKSLPHKFSWYGKKLRVIKSDYTDAHALKSATIAVADLLTASEYTLFFEFYTDGSLWRITQTENTDPNGWNPTYSFTFSNIEGADIASTINHYYEIFLSSVQQENHYENN